MTSDPDSPTHETANSPTTRDTLLIGRVARAHGNRGEVIVNLETDFPEQRFVAGRDLLVGPGLERRRMTSARFQRGRPVIALEGIETMSDAEALAGAELRVPASDASVLPENTFYRHDLVGCEVSDTAGRRIGRVTRVDGTLERSLLAVDTPRGEALIPLVDRICVSVDAGAKVIVIDPPEGLIELNERTSGSE